MLIQGLEGVVDIPKNQVTTGTYYIRENLIKLSIDPKKYI